MGWGRGRLLFGWESYHVSFDLINFYEIWLIGKKIEKKTEKVPGAYG